MPSIDERVVELEFDNSDFSRKVSQTMGDLKTLDNALKMGGSAAGIKEVSGAINKVDMNPLIAAAESVNNKFSVMRVVAATAISKITDTVMNAAKKLATFVPNKIIHGGWQRAANIAKSTFTLEGIIKDGDSMTDLTQAINDSVTGTAYAYDEASLAASSFYASGVGVDKMYQSLRAVAGVAAMTSSSYGDIARIFTTVSGNGRLMADQLNQISGRGLNAAAAIADVMGTTEEEVRRMVSSGEISFDQFSEAMFKKFGEHAAKANDTFDGAMANMQGVFNRIGAEFATPLMEGLIPVINAIREFLLSVKDVTDKLVAPFSQLVDLGSKFAVDLFSGFEAFMKSDQVVNSVQKFADKLTGIVNGLGGFLKPGKFVSLDDWKKIADAPYAGMLKDKLVELASAADENFKAMYDSYDSFEASLESGWLTKDLFSQAVNDLKGVADGLDEIGESAEITSGYLEECWQHVWEVERGDWGNGQERFDRLTEAGLSYHDIQGLVNHDLLGWDYTLEGLNTTLRESGKYTDEQIAALEAFARELEEDGSSLEEFMAIFDTVDKMSNLELVMGTLGNVAEFLREIFVDVSTAFSQVFSGSNASAFETFSEAFRYWLERLYVWSTKLDGFGSNGNVVYTVAKKFFTFLKTTGSAVGTVITGIFNAAKNVLSAFEPLLPIIGKIATGFVKFITGVKDGNEEMSILETVATAFSTAIEKVSGALGPIIQAFADWVTQGNYVERFFSGLSTVVSTLKPVFKSVGDSIRGAWDTARPYVEKFVQEFPGKFMEAFNAVKDFITPVVQSISGALSDLFGSAFGGTDLGDSFSSFFGAIESGEAILESFCDLVETVFTTVKDAVSDFFDLFGKTPEGFEWIEGAETNDSPIFGKNLIGSIRDFNTEAERTSDIVGPVSENLGSLMTLLETIGTIVQNVFGFIANMDMESFDTVFGYFAEGATVIAMFKFAQGFKGLSDGIGTFAEAVKGLPNAIASLNPFNAYASGMKAFGEAIRPGKFFEIALAISAVAVSLWLLSSVPIPNLVAAVLAMGAMAAIVGVLAAAMKKIVSTMTPEQAGIMESTGRSMIMFAGAIALVAIAALILEHVKWESLGKAALVFIALVAGAKILSAGAKDIGKAASVILAFAVALLILVVPITILGSLPIPMLVQGIAGLVAVMLGMAAAFRIMGKANLAKTAGAILAFAIALTILSGVIVILGSLNPTQLARGLLALAGVAVILVGGLVLLMGAARLLKFSAASFTALGTAALFLGVGLLAAATAVFILSQIGEGLWPAIGAFIVIAAVIAVLVVVLSIFGKGLAVAGAGMLAFGAGCMLVAASLVVAAAGLALLAMIAPVAGEALVLLARSIGRSAKILGKAFGEAIASFISAVGEAAAPIAEAMWNMAKEAMSRLAQGFIDSVGAVASKLSEMFKAFADAVSPHIPDFIASGVQIVVALIEGLSSQLDAIVQSAIDLVTSLINAIADALESNGVELRAACDHLVQSIIEFIIEFITGKETDLDEPSQGIGKAIVGGILGGFDLFGGDALTKVGEFATSILDKIKSVFGIGGSGGGSSEAKSIVGDFMTSFETEVDKSKAPIGGAMQTTMIDFLSKIDPKAAGTAATGVTGAVMTGLGGLSVEPGKVVQNGLGVMTGILSGAGSGLSSTASYAAGGITNAFSSASGAASSSVSSMTSNVTGEIGKSASPIESSARSSILGYVMSIARASGQASASARAVTNSVTSALKSGAGPAQSAGSSLASKFTAGIRGGGGGARSAASSIASSAAGAFGGYSAWGAGYNLSSGFASGISSGSYLASAAAAAVARSALNTIKKTAQERSPSRITRKYGAWFTEGWTIGILSLKDKSEAAAGEIGKSAVDTIGKFSDALSNGVDMSMDYNPTITPIVDLDNVAAASKAIGSMIDPGYGLGIGQYANSYGLYGAGGNTSSVVNNVSVALQYQAGSDANQMASDLASALTSKLNLEG